MGKTVIPDPIASRGDIVAWVNSSGEYRKGVVEMIGNGSTGDRIYGVRLPDGEYVHARESALRAHAAEAKLW